MNQLDIRDPGDGTSYMNLLLWGPPKVGKTTAAAGAPGVKLLFNTEQENSTRFAHRRDKDKHLVEPVIPPYADGTKPVYDLMTEIALGARDKAWDVVILDTAAELYRRLLEEFSSRAKNPSFEQRMLATTEMERWLRYMVDAPVSFIVVAHRMLTEGENEGAMSVPMVTSKTGSQSGIGPKLAGIVDVIAYAGVVDTEDGEQRVAQIAPGKGRDTGTRFPELETDEGYRSLDLEEWFKLANIKLNGVAQTLEGVAA